MRQLKRDFYTTCEMARVLGCAQQTVIRWIDNGRLKGFRLPGRQGERRCFKPVFRQHLIDHGVPLDRLEQLEQGLALAEAFTTPKGQN
jgi:two-component system, OmpR family, response regulator RpaA